MKMSGPSRVTIRLPPRSFRASSSSLRSCRAPESVSACSSRSRATSTRHSSRLRGGSFESFTAGTLDARVLRGRAGERPFSRGDFDQPAAGAEVDDPGGTDVVLGAPGLVDVPADRQRGALLLDRLEDRHAAEVIARAGCVAVALWRRVDHEHGALRTDGESLGSLLLVEVEAPVPGRDRDPRSEAEELRTVDLGPLAVEDGCSIPVLAGG